MPDAIPSRSSNNCAVDLLWLTWPCRTNHLLCWLPSVVLPTNFPRWCYQQSPTIKNMINTCSVEWGNHKVLEHTPFEWDISHMDPPKISIDQNWVVPPVRIMVVWGSSFAHKMGWFQGPHHFFSIDWSREAAGDVHKPFVKTDRSPSPQWPLKAGGIIMAKLGKKDEVSSILIIAGNHFLTMYRSSLPLSTNCCCQIINTDTESTINQ